MSIIEKLGLLKKVKIKFTNGIEALNSQLVGLKQNTKFNKSNNKQRQISNLIKGIDKTEILLRLEKTPDIFSAFSGRGVIQITNSENSTNEIEIEFKSKYMEMWFVLGMFIFMLLVFSPMIILGQYEFYWVLILIGFFTIVSAFKIYLFRNDVKKLEEEFNNLLESINNTL